MIYYEKELFNIALLGIVALVATFVACSDSSNFGEQETQTNNEMILKAIHVYAIHVPAVLTLNALAKKEDSVCASKR